MIINQYNFTPPNGTLTSLWITATGETDTTIISALNTWESDVNTAGLMPLFYAFYPFVGGSATKHKLNFINALDTDGAFRLDFSGGLTHNSNGVTGNASNGYANSHWIPSVNAITDDISIGFYSRTTNVTNADFGCNGGVTGLWNLNLGSDSYLAMNSAFSSSSGTVSSMSKYINYNRVSNTKKMYRDGTQVFSLSTSTDELRTDPLLFFTRFNDFYSDKNYASFDIKKSLTPTENATLATIMQTFQTNLSRQV